MWVVCLVFRCLWVSSGRTSICPIPALPPSTWVANEARPSEKSRAERIIIYWMRRNLMHHSNYYYFAHFFAFNTPTDIFMLIFGGLIVIRNTYSCLLEHHHFAGYTEPSSDPLRSGLDQRVGEPKPKGDEATQFSRTLRYGLY